MDEPDQEDWTHQLKGIGCVPLGVVKMGFKCSGRVLKAQSIYKMDFLMNVLKPSAQKHGRIQFLFFFFAGNAEVCGRTSL